MALNNVPPEAAIGFHRQLQVDKCALVDARERSSYPCFWCEVSAERLGLYVQCRQTNSTDRDTVAGAQFFRRVCSLNGDAAVFSALLNLSNLAHFFDDSG